MVKNWGEEATGIAEPVAGATKEATPKEKKIDKVKTIDLDDGEIPPPKTIIEGNKKTVITWELKDDDVTVEKKTRVFRLEERKVKVSQAVMERRSWPKFGVSKGLPSGPDTASTNVVADEVYLQLRSKKELVDDAEDSNGDKTINALRAALAKRAAKLAGGGAERIGGDDGGRIASGVYVAPANRKRAEDGGEPAGPGGKGVYVPPAQRPGHGGGSSMYDRGGDEATLRVTNISENTREDDLRELFRPFGRISRCYLALDKVTGLARGFAFINYIHREDAQRAIDNLNRHAYDHLILQVEWAEPRDN